MVHGRDHIAQQRRKRKKGQSLQLNLANAKPDDNARQGRKDEKKRRAIFYG